MFSCTVILIALKTSHDSNIAMMTAMLVTKVPTFVLSSPVWGQNCGSGIFQKCIVVSVALFFFFQQVGKALRYIPLVRTGVNKYSVTLKLISIVLLTMIPWMKVSQASTEGGFGSVSITSLASVLGWGLAMHILFIGIIFPPCLALKLNAPALKSVVIMASQKSLAVAVTISGYLPFSQAEQGIITLPLIVIHLGILIGDSILASCWFARDAKREKEAANRSTEVSIVDDKCEKNGIEFATSVTNQTLRITSL